MPGPHPIYSQDANVYLVSAEDKLAALDGAIERSGLLDNVEKVFQASGKARDGFLIAIKPNIMTASVRQDPSPVYTDPDLVEHLIGRLRQAGFTSVAVVESPNVYDYSYRERTVANVAAFVGYSGQGYRIADLSLEKEPFDYGSVLGKHVVGRTWRDADYRISFAKNKTHWQCFFTGCVKNVYGCLPEWDKMKHYHGRRREFSQCTILILDALPVHFGLLDAWVSGDGLTGHVRDARPNVTRTLFASENIYALDCVMAQKMGLEPMSSPVMREARRQWGSITPTPVGDMQPWRPWTNVRPITVKLLDIMEEFYWTSYFFSRALASPQDRRFPPVSRWQWFFGVLQAGTRLIERLLVKPA